MTDPNLIYYSNLLIRQYLTKPKAVQTIQLYANQSYCDGFPLQLDGCYDLSTAVGVQLTAIGKIVGVPRVIFTYSLANTYFNFTRYNSNQPILVGFGRYNDSPYDPDADLFYRYLNFDQDTYTLTDTELRTLIHIKIALNHALPTTKFITDLMVQYFSGQISVVDNLDMTITYTISSSPSNLTKAMLYLNFLPKPMGVGINLVFM